MLAHWIGQQTEKLRARQKAEGVEEGRAERDAEWREWYQRQIANGLTLDEPPSPPRDAQDKE